MIFEDGKTTEEDGEIEDDDGCSAPPTAWLNEDALYIVEDKKKRQVRENLGGKYMRN